MTTIYRSIFSGKEIDEAIAGMKVITISNDFLGGTTKAASAELAKILDQRMDKIEDPEYLKVIVEQMSDSNIFTDAHLAKLTNLRSNLRGVFTNNNERDTILGNEVAIYAGKEICLVFDNGAGLPEFQRWNPTAAKWVRVNLDGQFDDVTRETAGLIPTFSFKTATHSTMKILVSAGSADNTKRQVQEIVVTYAGADTYLSVFGDVGNASLFTADTTMVNGVVTLNINTTTTNVKLSAKLIALV